MSRVVVMLFVFVLISLMVMPVLAKDYGEISWISCPITVKPGEYVEFKVKVTCYHKDNISQLWSVVLCVDYNGDGQGDYWPGQCQKVFQIKPGKNKTFTFGWIVPTWIVKKLKPGQNEFYVYFDLWNNPNKGSNGKGWIDSTPLRAIKLGNVTAKTSESATSNANTFLPIPTPPQTNKGQSTLPITFIAFCVTIIIIVALGLLFYYRR